MLIRLPLITYQLIFSCQRAIIAIVSTPGSSKWNCLQLLCAVPAAYATHKYCVSNERGGGGGGGYIIV